MMDPTTSVHDSASTSVGDDLPKNFTQAVTATNSFDTTAPPAQSVLDIAKSQTSLDATKDTDDTTAFPETIGTNAVPARSPSPGPEDAVRSKAVTDEVPSTSSSATDAADKVNPLALTPPSSRSLTTDETDTSEAQEQVLSKRKASPSVHDEGPEKRAKLGDGSCAIEDFDGLAIAIQTSVGGDSRSGADWVETPVMQSQAATTSKAKVNGDTERVPDSGETSPERPAIVVDSGDEDGEEDGEDGEDGHDVHEARPASSRKDLKSKNEKATTEREPGVTESKKEYAATDDLLVEDTRPSKRLVSRAAKELDESCLGCNKKAKKAYKVTFDHQVAELKDKHTKELAGLRAKFRDEGQNFKARTEKATNDTKASHTRSTNELKEKHEKATAKLKEKLASVEKESKQKYDELKKKTDEKVRKVSQDFEKADSTRKDLDKALKKERKDHEDEQRANELRLKEEKRQLIREQQDVLKDLRPEHSSAVRAKEKELKEAAKEIESLKSKLEQSKQDVRSTLVDASADQERFEHRGTELSRFKAKYQRLEDAQFELERQLTMVEERAKVDVAREHDKLEMLRGDYERQTQMLVEQRRACAVQQQAVDRHAKSVERLKEGSRLLKDELDAVRVELEHTKERAEAAEAELQGMRIMAAAGDDVGDVEERFHTPEPERQASASFLGLAGLEMSMDASPNEPVYID